MARYDDGFERPTRKVFGYSLLWALMAVVILLVVGYVWAYPALFLERQTAIYRTETDTQAYEHSRTYQQSAQQDFARYCYQMQTATTPSAKSAVAGLIRNTRSTYDGPVSPDVQTCLADAGTN